MKPAGFYTAGVPPKEHAEVLLWAFGPGPIESASGSDLRDRWNRRNAEHFVIGSLDPIDDTMVRIGKAWIEHKNKLGIKSKGR